MKTSNLGIRLGAMALFAVGFAAGCGDEDSVGDQRTQLVEKPGIAELCAHTGCVDTPFAVPAGEALVMPVQIGSVPAGREVPDQVAPTPHRDRIAGDCRDETDRQNFCVACNTYSMQCMAGCGFAPGDDADPDPRAYQQGPESDCLRAQEGACREAQLNCHACQTCERLLSDRTVLECSMSRALCQADCDALGPNGCQLCMARAAARCN